MKLLILGGTGMLGYQMLKECLNRGIDVYAALRNPSKLPDALREQVSDRMFVLEDAGNWLLLEECITHIEPNFVINCVGIVKQSQLAKSHIESITINSLLPHKLERFGNRYGFSLIHISTDCVFRGDKGMYSESDTPDADDLYGRSKLLGEVSDGCGLTLRTSIIGHELESSTNGLLEWFLSSKVKVEGYTDAIFSGLTTNELSKVILDKVISMENIQGLFHVASEPISKFDLLELISQVYEKQILIEPSSRLKIDRSLNGSKFSKATGYRVPAWEKMIQDMKND